jgi:hypothetical protein
LLSGKPASLSPRHDIATPYVNFASSAALTR